MCRAPGQTSRRSVRSPGSRTEAEAARWDPQAAGGLRSLAPLNSSTYRSLWRLAAASSLTSRIPSCPPLNSFTPQLKGSHTREPCSGVHHHCWQGQVLAHSQGTDPETTSTTHTHTHLFICIVYLARHRCNFYNLLILHVSMLGLFLSPTSTSSVLRT